MINDAIRDSARDGTPVAYHGNGAGIASSAGGMRFYAGQDPEKNNDLGEQTDRGREHPTKDMQHNARREMAQTYMQILCHTRKTIVWEEFSGEERPTGKKRST
ncbi:hypothetical protein ACS0TY_024820 [Phlomoides rotata]